MSALQIAIFWSFLFFANGSCCLFGRLVCTYATHLSHVHLLFDSWSVHARNHSLVWHAQTLQFFPRTALVLDNTSWGNQPLGSAVRELFLELVVHVHVDDPLSPKRSFLTLVKCYLVVVRVPSKQCLWPLTATTADAKSTQPTSNTHLPVLLQVTQRQQSYQPIHQTRANTWRSLTHDLSFSSRYGTAKL